MRNFKVWVLLVVFGLVIGAIGGCGGGSKNNSGNGDLPPVNPWNPGEPLPGEPESGEIIGFATEGFQITGGAGGSFVIVTTGQQLSSLMKAREKKSTTPLTVYIQGTLTYSDKVDIKDTANISIFGVGTDATIHGFGLKIVRASNIIIRNLTFKECLNGEKDAIEISESSHHVWVDHCDFSGDLTKHKDYYDGLLDVTNQADYVTISWSKFHNHWKTTLVGNSDTKTGDIGKLKVTYHHNWFDGTNSRNPSIRFGTGHIFNNYYSDIKKTDLTKEDGYGIASRKGAQVLVESNYFKNVTKTMGTDFFVHKDEPKYGYINARNNILDNSGEPSITHPCDYEAPYQYSVDDVNSIPTLVMAGAGATLNIIPPDVQATPPSTTPGPTSTGPIQTPIPEDFVPLVETFNNVPDDTQINKDNTALDNPDHFPSSGMSGNIVAGTAISGSGAISLGSQRMAFNVTGFGSAINPILKVTIKNDDGNGAAVESLKLAVGDSYSTGGKVGESGVKTHGEYYITNTSYEVITIPLDIRFTNTNTIQFRGIVGSSGTAGLHIDQIEVVESP